MRTLSLSARLAIGHLVVIAALLLVGGAALSAFAVASRQISDVHDYYVPGIAASGRLARRLERMEVAEFMYFAAPPTRQAAMQDFDRASHDFDVALAALRRLAIVPTERAEVAEIARRYDAFVRIDRELRTALALGRVAEARRLDFTTSLATAAALRAATQRALELNRAAAEAARMRADLALGTMAALASCATLLGTLAALVAWRRSATLVVGPVQALQAGTEALAAGRPTEVHHPAAAATTELASLEAAFNRMAGELREAAERLQAANTTLESQVAARTAALHEANVRLESVVAELRSLDRLKSDLLAVVSHELLTPLNFISGFGSILEDELLGSLTPEQHDAVVKINEGADRLTRMVRNTLLYAQVEDDRIVFVPAAGRPEEVLRTTATRAEAAAAARGVSIAVEAAADLPALWADPERLGCVLDELVDNAVKFTPRGGRVRLSAEAAEAGVTLVVADEGPGMAPQVAGRIFQPFFQADLTSTRAHGGLGLGLAIASRLVARMGGVLLVDTAPGRGATFRLTMPRAGGPQEGGTDEQAFDPHRAGLRRLDPGEGVGDRHHARRLPDRAPRDDQGA